MAICSAMVKAGTGSWSEPAPQETSTFSHTARGNLSGVVLFASDDPQKQIWVGRLLKEGEIAKSCTRNGTASQRPAYLNLNQPGTLEGYHGQSYRKQQRDREQRTSRAVLPLSKKSHLRI